MAIVMLWAHTLGICTRSGVVEPVSIILGFKPVDWTGRDTSSLEGYRILAKSASSKDRASGGILFNLRFRVTFPFALCERRGAG
jgi:hypothetical protein